MTDTQPRLLALFSSTTSDEQIAAETAALDSALLGTLGVAFRLTNSLDWYREAFPRCGSWDSWVWESVNGLEYGTRRRYFDGFVVCSDPLGRATGQLVTLALLHNRAVLRYIAGELGQVKAVRPLANEQYAVEHMALGEK